MAKLGKMPQKEIIDGFKGLIDFYYWMGIPVARRWPRHFPRTPSPAEATIQTAFAYINRLWGDLPLIVKAQLTLFAAQSTLTGKDVLVRGYIKGLYNLMPPEYYATEATQLLIKALLDIIATWAHQDNTLLAYHDTYGETPTIPGTGGLDFALGSSPPADEVWFVTSISAWHDDPAPRAVSLVQNIAAGDMYFANDFTLATWKYFDRQGQWTLKAGESIRARFDLLAIGQTGYLSILGYKMKIT